MTKLPRHFIITSFDGALLDRRTPGFTSNPPLRAMYRAHYHEINTVAELKATLRECACIDDLGGNPLHFVSSDGAILSPASVRAELRNVIAAIQTGAKYYAEQAAA